MSRDFIHLVSSTGPRDPHRSQLCPGERIYSVESLQISFQPYLFLVECCPQYMAIPLAVVVSLEGDHKSKSDIYSRLVPGFRLS